MKTKQSKLFLKIFRNKFELRINFMFALKSKHFDMLSQYISNHNIYLC